jgi:glycosyltransferase involved in cell wall biosynthesis
MSTSNIIKNRDIVVVGQQPWDTEIGSNCKNIAIEFSKYNRVLYVNSPLDRISKFKHKNDPKIKKRIDVINKTTDGLLVVKENLWNYFPDEIIESINWIKNDIIYNLLNRVNNIRFARSITRAINKLGFKDIILFNDNDIFRCFYLKDLLKPATSIYYSRDYLLAVDYWKHHGRKLEPLLIKKSDLCVANSPYLANYCRKYNKNSFYVGQGCELEMFSRQQNAAIPHDIIDIPKPIIGYVGALQSIRLDIELLGYIAKQKPDWSIVLVGPEDDEFKKSDLHHIPNIYFLGSKNPSELPAYIHSFNVCINPQIVNEVTIGNYPRKIDEYLATGKPVVATKTEGMSIFREHVNLATSKEDYISMIAKSLEENDEELQQVREAFAMSHSWENSVKEIYRSILSVSNKTNVYA